jgi:hypothetical protein
MDRAEWLYQYWLEQSTLFTDSEKLGNVAAIHRWETATMGRSLERVVPPAALAGAHASVIEALELASRAAQLLSSGSRFHNANAVCEGQSLLGTSRERRLAALKSMRRYLLQVPPPQLVEIEPSPNTEGAAPNELVALAAAPDPVLEMTGTEHTAQPEEQPMLPGEAALIETASPVPAFLDSLDSLPSAPQPPAGPLESPSPASPAAPAEAPPPTEHQVSTAQPGWGTLFGRSESQSER